VNFGHLYWFFLITPISKTFESMENLPVAFNYNDCFSQPYSADIVDSDDDSNLTEHQDHEPF